MRDFGLVSIITPNHNGARFVEQTIKSVLAQTYTNWEALIQDDNSTDNSMEILEKWAAMDERIKVERNPQNAGAAVTRNNAIKRSKGHYLAFLDSDDIWLPEKLEKQISFMVENKCDFSFTRYEHIDENGKSLYKQANVTRHLSYRKMMMHCWPGCLTVMYRQDQNNKIYCGDVKKNNDTALFLRAIKICKNGMGLDECLALYRIRKGSISRNKWKIIKPFVKVIYEFEGKSLFWAYFCVFTHNIIKVLFKYRKITSEQSVAGYIDQI
nr:glycosyltransferase family 2 protein [Prevotella sp.]